MEFEVKQHILNKSLSRVGRVASNTATLKILNNILLSLEDNTLTLTANNLDLATQESLSVSTKKGGRITVPAAIFTELVHNLPNTKVHIKVANDKMTVKADDYRAVINCVSPDDFPEIPDLEKEVAEFTISATDFSRVVGSVAPAASNDNARPILTGVYFNMFDKQLFIAATDGYRLASAKLLDQFRDELRVVVPVGALQEVIRSSSDDDQITVLCDSAQIKFRFGSLEITSKLIPGNFPDYRQLIPDSSNLQVDLDRHELIRIVRLASIFAKSSGGAIKVIANKSEQSLTVESLASEVGENSTKIASTEIKTDLSVTLSARFLLDALNSLENDQISLECQSGGDRPAPVVLRETPSDPDYVHLIMPILR
ncbi:DNA polymerase III subunit beta [Candidatus Saccharibacteria bacterium]|nr:DNA polymerase III subunit beta [Candidatus Saccharibacteria bacterium]